MSRSRRDAWIERMARYQKSALSVKEFCSSEAVSVPSFYQWKKKLAAPPKNVPAFVSVSLDQSHQAAAATLRLPGGATIDLAPTLNVDRLRPIIQAVVEVTLSKAAYDEATR